MRIFLGILLITVLGFTSCEGRISKTQALEKDIKEFQDSVSIQVDVYKPKNYLEREVDTTLSNGFRVKIKTYTDMDNNVLFTKIKDTINYQKYYRNFKFEILVEKSGKYLERTKNENGTSLIYIPCGPSAVLVILESCWQASIFLNIASSKPE